MVLYATLNRPGGTHAASAGILTVILLLKPPSMVVAKPPGPLSMTFMTILPALLRSPCTGGGAVGRQEDRQSL